MEENEENDGNNENIMLNEEIINVGYVGINLPKLDHNSVAVNDRGRRTEKDMDSTLMFMAKQVSDSIDITTKGTNHHEAIIPLERDSKLKPKKRKMSGNEPESRVGKSWCVSQESFQQLFDILRECRIDQVLQRSWIFPHKIVIVGQVVNECIGIVTADFCIDTTSIPCIENPVTWKLHLVVEVRDWHCSGEELTFRNPWTKLAKSLRESNKWTTRKEKVVFRV